MSITTAAHLPRRRRGFTTLREPEVRELARPVLGPAADTALVERPDQGVNNRTYLLRTTGGAGVAIKMRPYSPRPVRNSALWPRYTQELYGPIPNGDISTLISLTQKLSRHGSIRPPQILRVDVSREGVAAPYVISELLPGRPLGWDKPRPVATAEQLGEHVGRVHAATAGTGFGIYANRAAFSLADWWSRFGRSYGTLAGELIRCSSKVAGAARLLEAALRRAIESEAPAGSALICLDQSPTH